MYSSLNPGSNNLIWPNATGNLRAFVEDLFHEYNVDLYLVSLPATLATRLDGAKALYSHLLRCVFVGIQCGHVHACECGVVWCECGVVW